MEEKNRYIPNVDTHRIDLDTESETGGEDAVQVESDIDAVLRRLERQDDIRGGSWRAQAIQELIEVFHDHETARFVVAEAGFPRARMPVFKTALQFWSHIAEESEKGVIGGDILPILQVAAGLYPSNEVFGCVGPGSGQSDPHRTGSKTVTSSRRIFIVHAPRDFLRVRGLVHLLRALGHDVCTSSSSARYGEDVARATRRAMFISDLIMVMWTENAKRSVRVEHEYTLALAQDSDKRVVPLEVDPGVPLPVHLKERRTIAFPLVADILEERGSFMRDSGSPVDLAEAVDEVLERHNVSVNRAQRRDVLLFALGSVTMLGVVGFLSLVRSLGTTTSLKTNTSSAAFGLAIGFAMVLHALPGSWREAVELPPGSIGPDAEEEELAVRMRLGLAAEVEKEEGDIGDSGEDESGEEEDDEGLAARKKTSVDPAKVCEGARLAVFDLRRMGRTMGRGVGREVPGTEREAVKKYTRSIYSKCEVLRFGIEPKLHLEVACETRFESALPAMRHGERVSAGVDGCLSPSRWIRHSSPPSFRGGDPKFRYARKDEYISGGCDDVSVSVYSGKCLMSRSPACSGFHAEMSGDFLTCLVL